MVNNLVLLDSNITLIAASSLARPEKLGGLLREVVRPRLESVKRWKLRFETVLDQLVEVLGQRQVLETVCAKVTQFGARGEPILGEPGGDRG